ncbi:Transposase IS66 family protein [Anoxynatronum buryatiense]|uniref:Transposase IS66 family protein n=1 Tax=Anoxynatronum buryatiense TaxID=489973 RepID=A0AA45WXX2_9CLOT|nr:Transposase IS66 family protein [Anoxynatronum buryatiense]
MGYRVQLLCHLVGLSRASYCRLTALGECKGKPVLAVVPSSVTRYSYDLKGTKYDDPGLKKLLEDIVAGEGYNYGYRKLTFCLRAKHHIHINKKKVYRLCKEAHLLKPARKPKRKSPRVLARNRFVTGPNQLWQGDIKYGYIHGEERSFYILSFIDVFEMFPSACMATRPPRPANTLDAFLKGFKGYLHTDGYQGYNQIPGVKVIGCWAHYPSNMIIREDI